MPRTLKEIMYEIEELRERRNRLTEPLDTEEEKLQEERWEAQSVLAAQRIEKLRHVVDPVMKKLEEIQKALDDGHCEWSLTCEATDEKGESVIGWHASSC